MTVSHMRVIILERFPPKTCRPWLALHLWSTVRRALPAWLGFRLSFYPKGERRAAFAVIEIQQVAVNFAAETGGASVIMSDETIPLDIQGDVMTVGTIQRKTGTATLA
jgi:hypothetical protein